MNFLNSIQSITYINKIMNNLYSIKEVAANKYENAINKGDNKSYLTGPNTFVKYGLQSSQLNNENLPDGMGQGRPTTALMRVIDKFSAISGFGSSQTASGDLASGLGSGGIKDKKIHYISAYQLQHKIGKIVKIESKLMSLQSDLVGDLSDWASNIPNSENEKMVKKFSNLISIQKDSNLLIIEKLDKLKINLAFVNEREKKQNDLIAAKNKILKQLRDSEVKYGPNSSATTLLREKLEENICNLGIVEIQYIRSISKNLKESLIDYLYALQSVSTNLSEATNEYYETLLAIEANSDISRNSPRKVANQSSPLVNVTNERKNMSADIFAVLNKSARDSEYEALKHNIDLELNTASEGKPNHNAISKGYSVCTDCLKTSKYNSLNTDGCTHKSIDEISGQFKDGDAFVQSKVSPDLHPYDQKDPYQTNDNWN